MGKQRVSNLFGLIFVAQLAVGCNGGVTSTYRRRLAEPVDMPLDADVIQVPPGYNAPQQVHITQGDYDGSAVIVSWVTADEAGSNIVLFGISNTTLNMSAEGNVIQYHYYNYTSGYIHHCTLEHLVFDTMYYYTVGVGGTNRTFYFKTPPQPNSDASYTFGLIGDFGQTYDSNSTLTHYKANPDAATLLFLGDFSYADGYPYHNNVRWDTWGRFIESSVAYQPWIWTVGNHEIDFAPELGETTPFKPMSNRYPTPYEASGSTEQYYYSVRRASAHIIVLASYSAYGQSTPQYGWLESELKKVNRTVTPWLIVLMHAPWYNSYDAHYMEGETMRVQFEAWMVQYKVDVVFAGHVHAYERSHRVSNIAYNITNANCTPVSDNNAPVYITVGDGGNREGLVTSMTEPQPSYSAFREESFGHGIFYIKNKTHALFTWHRNQDGEDVAADSIWLSNRYFYPSNDS
ncbi:Purple acid phosphatase [Rhynchospora pubera]|uniref:Purple acid phosphatase n=1 Tax=Rhynchospora pubera TaxID=906938 RepID=A0AAV8EZC4_9POAL|nr:Purple acid phosphatase [Rhynchospora pubera]